MKGKGESNEGYLMHMKVYAFTSIFFLSILTEGNNLCDFLGPVVQN